jgi:hypothetical protein
LGLGAVSPSRQFVRHGAKLLRVRGRVRVRVRVGVRGS